MLKNKVMVVMRGYFVGYSIDKADSALSVVGVPLASPSAARHCSNSTIKALTYAVFCLSCNGKKRNSEQDKKFSHRG